MLASFYKNVTQYYAECAMWAVRCPNENGNKY